uniref:Uncharacterized protein n=1 Tax=Sciurus vulgaris TaxID=55149 RepID=A0A8D2CJG8_SCIVU
MWLINDRNLFLTVLEVGKSPIKLYGQDSSNTGPFLDCILSALSCILTRKKKGWRDLLRFPLYRTLTPGFQMLFWQQFWQPSLKCAAKNLK